MGMALDDTNLGLLRMLHHDARTSVADLARQVGRSEAVVRDRVRALEDAGIIKGYCARVDGEALGLAVEAIVRAAADLHVLRRGWQTLHGNPYVLSAAIVTGNRPLHMRIAARDARHLDDVIESLARTLGLIGVETEMILEPLVGERVISPGIVNARDPPLMV